MPRRLSYYFAMAAFVVGLSIQLAMAAEGQAPAASADPPAPSSAPRPCTSEKHRQFDFWLGEWDVLRPDGTKSGVNRIEAILGGCAIRESWEGMGMSGTSVSSVDSTTGGWHQTWVDSTGLLLRIDGGLEGGAMVMRGRAPIWGREGVFQQETRWTPRPDGSLQQTGRLLEPDGKTWTVVYDLTYRRRG